MGRYSHLVHKSDLITYDKFTWCSPELSDKKPNLQGIFNRIIHSVNLINFILTERDKQVNIFRKIAGTNEKSSNNSWYLILFTESYFTYAQNVLNAYAELIYETMENMPTTVSGDFPKLWNHLRTVTYLHDKEICDYFQNKTLWYQILIQSPRNNLVIHDKETAGYGISDHEIDVYIGKHGSHDPVKNKPAIELLQKIISNHTEFHNMRIDDYFHPLYRQIVAKIDILNQQEITWLINAGGIAGFDFPYIPQITPKLQEIINFIENWLRNKYQTCPQCKNPHLEVTRFAINPQILKFDPKNIWFGWKCTTCSYMKPFNESENHGSLYTN